MKVLVWLRACDDKDESAASRFPRWPNQRPTWLEAENQVSDGVVLLKCIGDIDASHNFTVHNRFEI